MKTVYLSKSDFLLLEKIIESSTVEKLSLIFHGDNIAVSGTDNQLVSVVESIGDELAKCGFSENFEPNYYGLTLERLIDLFSVVYD